MAHIITHARHADLEQLAVRLGVSFHNISLLDEALTHPSFTNESKDSVPHNERLEFLGDAVLELASSTYLYMRFPTYSEGALTKMRASLVQSNTLARLSRKLGLGHYLRMGRGELRGGGAERQNNLENAFEAVIGAIYLDSGWQVAKEYVCRQLSAEAEHIAPAQVMRDYKTALQEYVQKDHRKTISYVLVSESGPDHDKRFTTRVLIDDQSMGEGTGRSKKEAEQHAAAQALERLR